MAHVSKGKIMYFIDGNGNQLHCGEIISQGSKNAKLKEYKQRPERDMLWTVFKGFLGDTEEEARELHTQRREREVEFEQKKYEANRLNFGPNTMAYFDDRGKKTLLQVMEDNGERVSALDSNRQLWTYPKTLFISLAEGEKLFRQPHLNRIIPGDDVIFFEKGRYVKAHVIGTRGSRFEVNIHGRPGTIGISKLACELAQ